MPNKERYAQFKKDGKCPNCNTKHEEKFVFCERCRNKIRQKTYKDKFCVDCGVLIPLVYWKRRADRCEKCSYERDLGVMRDWYKNLPPDRKVKARERYTNYRRKWRDEHPAEDFDYALKRKYGISFIEIQEIYNSQGGKCAICKKPFPDLLDAKNRRLLHVDHCHATGTVRGLLCNNCNSGIGLLQENTEILSSAINYLSKFSP